MIALAAMAAAAFCTPTATDAKPAAVVDSFLAAYNARDFDGMRRTLAADAVITRYPEERLRTGVTLLEAYRDTTFKALPDVQLTVLARMESQDVVVNRERMTAALTGPDEGL